MHLPNHPDTLFEYVKALKECGYRWLLVQEHSVEQFDGAHLTQDQKYIPNQLVARNSNGENDFDYGTDQNARIRHEISGTNAAVF